MATDLIFGAIGLVAGALVTTLVLACVCKRWLGLKVSRRGKGIDPSQSTANGCELGSATPAPQAQPTVARDGILAVLEHKRVKPWDLRDIEYGAEIGSGAFGVVMKATLRGTDCAIKQLHKGERSSDMLSGLLEEFDTMMQLRHPNVLLTMGVAVHPLDQTIGILMELMRASLSDLIYEPSFAPFASWTSAFLPVAMDITRGMANIHYHGLLHCDLKPGNVLLDQHFSAKVADFGTGRSRANAWQEEKEGGEIAGTPPYMAPEILLRRTYAPSVDVWAFGCVLAHMATGTVPYMHLRCTGRRQLFEAIKDPRHTPLEQLLTSTRTPSELVELATDCCQRDPSVRPGFKALSARLSALGREDKLRPVARIWNKQVAQAVGGSKAATDKDATTARAAFREHFREKARDSMSSPRQAAGSASPEGGAASSRPAGILDTFTATFTANSAGSNSTGRPMSSASPAPPAPPVQHTTTRATTGGSFCAGCGEALPDAGGKFCPSCARPVLQPAPAMKDDAPVAWL